MGDKDLISRPAVNISPADVIAYSSARRQKPTRLEAKRWLQRHRVQIEEGMRDAVSQRLEHILGQVVVIEFPDPRVDQKYRIVDSAIMQAIDSYCETTGNEEESNSFHDDVILEAVQHLLGSPHWRGMMCIPYNVEFVQRHKEAERREIANATDRVHIVVDSGEIKAELASASGCRHGDRDLVLVEKQN